MKQYPRIATKFPLHYFLAAGSFIKRETHFSLEFIAELTTLCFLSFAITELLFIFLPMNTAGGGRLLIAMTFISNIFQAQAVWQACAVF